MRQPLVAANWKMHGSMSAVDEFVQQLHPQAGVDVVVLPPSLYVAHMAATLEPGFSCGVQDVGIAASGAHTGELAAEMVYAVGGRWAVVGHSERRIDQQETDDLVATKTAAALRGGLHPIVCVGETLEQRQAGDEMTVVARQLEQVFGRVTVEQLLQGRGAIAYEPVWAIGTGETATPGQAQQMHGFIRGLLAQQNAQAAQGIRIVYGGSVKPDNARLLFVEADIDGALVGGAGLEASSFSAIIEAAASIK